MPSISILPLAGKIEFPAPSSISLIGDPVIRRAVLTGALLLASQVWAQKIGFGIKGGVRTTNDINTPGIGPGSESKRYVVGPAVELALPFGFGIEVDALYRRVGFETSDSSFAGSFQSRYRANSWEFPILLKSKLPFPLLKPFWEAGYAPRRISGSSSTVGTTVDIPTGKVTNFSSSGGWNPDTSHGLVAGVGGETGLGKIHVSGELRYTRWNNDPISFTTRTGNYVNMSQNQVDFLIGLTWR
jgi:hypothetical protein